MKKYKENIISSKDTVKDGLKKISNLKIKTLLVVDKNKKFLGTITDGDIRRFSLKKNYGLNLKLEKIVNRNTIYINFKKEVINQERLKKEKKEILIPSLNKNQKIFSIQASDEKKSILDKSNIKVLILAGGEGRRLRPLTRYTPKPLVKISEKSVLQILVENLINYNFTEINVSTNYLANKISSHLKILFPKMNFKFLKETKPLGTAGPISKIKTKTCKYILLINADIITKINFDNFIDFHIKNNFDFTIAGHVYETMFNYGIINKKKIDY